MNGMNEAVNAILNLKRQGYSPQAVMNMMAQQNPQLQMVATQMRNMAQGRSPREFITQLARQNGMSEENLNEIMKMF